MEKLAYVLFHGPEVPGSEIREALLEKAAPRLRQSGARALRINVHDEVTAGGTPIQRSTPPIRAFVTFWLENADDRRPCQDALAACAQSLAGYLVVESRPLVHATRPGDRTPGMNQVTCIVRRPDLEDAEFFHRWNEEHKQVALSIQSIDGYVRNAVVRPLTEGAPAWEGIVEETYPIEALTDPRAFYDAESDAQLKERMAQMMESVRGFLDLSKLECTPMSEYDLG